MFGINTVVSHCWTDVPVADMRECDSCAGAFGAVHYYVFVNVLFNLFSILVLKIGSASLLNIISTLKLPLTQFAFSLPIIQSPPDALHMESLIGLLVICSGMGFYQYGENEIEKRSFKNEHRKPIMFASGTPFAAISIRGAATIIIAKNRMQIRHGLYAKLGIIGTPSASKAGTPRGGSTPVLGPRKFSYLDRDGATTLFLTSPPNVSPPVVSINEAGEGEGKGTDDDYKENVKKSLFALKEKANKGSNV